MREPVSLWGAVGDSSTCSSGPLVTQISAIRQRCAKDEPMAGRHLSPVKQQLNRHFPLRDKPADLVGGLPPLRELIL